MKAGVMATRLSVLTRALPSRILVVDDDEQDRELLTRRLSAAGFEARHEPLLIERSGPNGEQVTIRDNGSSSAASFGVAGIGEPGQQGLAGLTVEFPEGEGPLLSSPPPGGGEPVLDDGAGVRIDPSGTVSIRSGTKVTVVVMTEP